MHFIGIAHGDIYAHNILVNKDASSPLPDGPYAKLFDFGAAFFYPKGRSESSFESSEYSPEEEGNGVEAVEVRAFGLLLQDMAEYLFLDAAHHATTASLLRLANACVDSANRPTFARLASMLAQFKRAPAA
jgi:hypothetical protein